MSMNLIIAITAMCLSTTTVSIIFLILTLRERNRLFRLILSDKERKVDDYSNTKQSEAKKHTSLMKKHMERMRSDK